MIQQISADTQPEMMEVFRGELAGVLDGSLSTVFHFQPVVDLHSAVAVGYEALVRFGGDLRWSPDRWFMAAGHLGRRSELETLVLRGALDAATQLPADTFLSVNVGPDYLVSDEWDRVLADYGSLTRIVVEITEQDVIRDYRRVQQKIAAIRARGGTVATDDVGAGYASLRHVMEIRPDFVKLDRGFIEGCHGDPARAAMIEMLGTIAGRLDAWIIAEGVEVQAELEELMRLDVPLAQGYFMGRPVPQMSSITDQSRESILQASMACADNTSVRRTLESCLARTGTAVAIEQLERDPQAEYAMVTDTWGRPRQLVERHPLMGIRTPEHLMKVQIDSAPNEVIERALARPLAARFDPMAAINERGEFLGLLRVDRLMNEVLHKTAPVIAPRSRENVLPYLVRSQTNFGRGPANGATKLEG